MALWSRLALYGFTTYAAVFMFWTVASSYGFSYGMAPRITSYVLTVIVIYAATAIAKPVSFTQAFTIGVFWACMHVMLDAIVVIPSAGLAPFFAPFVWIEYGIVFITPVAASLHLLLHKQTPTSIVPSL